jgi:capsid assembly protease
MVNLSNTELWLGTESSFEDFKSKKLEFTSNKRFSASSGDDDHAEGGCSGYSLINGTAIIRIKGVLVNEDLSDFEAELFGLTSYTSLQQAFYNAAIDSEVSKVVLDVNSPGGSVDGMSATYEALKFLKSKKPIATYVESCCSAAYWLGSIGEHIVMSNLGKVGSIGVITICCSAKKQLDNEGIQPLVIRSSPKKNLLNGYEDFSAEAIQKLQSSVDYCHNIFVNAVAQNRGLSFEHVNSVMADGDTFFGQEAIDRRFVDAIGTFQTLLTTWQPQTVGGHNFQHGSQMAVLNGDPLMTLNAEVKTPEPQISDNNSQVQLTELTSKLAELTTQNSNLTAINTELTAANKVLAASLVDKEQVTADYENLLKSSIQSKANALNTEVIMPSDLNGLKAMDQQLDVKFQEKFPAGGVAVTNPKALESTAPVEDAWMARIKNR